MFQPEVFWKQMYCIKESTCDTFVAYWYPLQSSGTPHTLAVIWHPHSDLRCFGSKCLSSLSPSLCHCIGVSLFLWQIAKIFWNFNSCVHLWKNKSQKVSIKNAFYTWSNKALKMKTCQLMRSVILVLNINDYCYNID